MTIRRGKCSVCGAKLGASSSIFFHYPYNSRKWKRRVFSAAVLAVVLAPQQTPPAHAHMCETPGPDPDMPPPPKYKFDVIMEPEGRGVSSTVLNFVRVRFMPTLACLNPTRSCGNSFGLSRNTKIPVHVRHSRVTATSVFARSAITLNPILFVPA